MTDLEFYELKEKVENCEGTAQDEDILDAEIKRRAKEEEKAKKADVSLATEIKSALKVADDFWYSEDIKSAIKASKSLEELNHIMSEARRAIQP